MKKYLLLILTMITLWSCKSTPIEEYNLIPILEKAKLDLINQDTVKVAFDQVAEFDWDGILFIEHYFRKKSLDHLKIKNLYQVRKQLNYMEGTDFKELLLFIRNDSVVSYSWVEGKLGFNFFQVNEGLNKLMLFSKEILNSKTYMVYTRGYGNNLRRESIYYDLSDTISNFTTKNVGIDEIQFHFPKSANLEYDSGIFLGSGISINDIKRLNLKNYDKWSFEINHTIMYNDNNNLLLIKNNRITQICNINKAYLGAYYIYLGENLLNRFITAKEIDHKLFIKKNQLGQYTLSYKE